jgi:hypothetical protein
VALYIFRITGNLIQFLSFTGVLDNSYKANYRQSTGNKKKKSCNRTEDINGY